MWSKLAVLCDQCRGRRETGHFGAGGGPEELAEGNKASKSSARKEREQGREGEREETDRENQIWPQGTHINQRTTEPRL
jgi:hypothetical protein